MASVHCYDFYHIFHITLFSLSSCLLTFLLKIARLLSSEQVMSHLLLFHIIDHSHLKMYFSWLHWLLLTLTIYLLLSFFGFFFFFLVLECKYFLRIGFFLYFSNLLWTVALVSPFFKFLWGFSPNHSYSRVPFVPPAPQTQKHLSPLPHTFLFLG